MKSYITSLLFLLATVFGVSAQIVTTDPDPVQVSSENLVIYYHSDQGNKGLLNQPASDPVYAHTGVITDKSNGAWAYAPVWKDNSAKYKLEYVSENLWKLNIGDIRTYFGITDDDEQVLKLCFVFRNATASKEGKTSTGGDIFVDVVSEGFSITLTNDNPNGNLITESSKNVVFTVAATQTADITLSVNGEQIAAQKGVKKLEAAYNFENRGTYTVKAVAVAAGLTEVAEEIMTFPDSSVAENYPGGVPKPGTVKQADGSVIFCAAAPQKQDAILVGSWNNYGIENRQVMKYQDYQGNRYFWTSVSDLDSDTWYPYYYIFDNVNRVGDPYAKLILDPYNDKYITDREFPGLMKYPEQVSGNIPLAVYWENVNKYDWKVKDFKGAEASDLIVYELLFRDFTGNEGKADANGTVREAIKKIPYLKALGVNAIELMPIMEFNGNNSWGYNTNFYFAPDKAYGTPADYKEFIDLCHQNGMAVILDIVFNQSDGLHPWYQMYPVSSNPFYNQYAPHAYSVLNDWNQDNLLVQQQWFDCVQYWMKEYKVDGYRFDLVKGLGDNDSYGGSNDYNTNKYNASRVARMKKIHAAMKEVNPDAYFINENLAGDQEENEMAADGQLNWANINNSSCQYAMGYSTDAVLNRFYAPQDSRTWGSTVSYMESHDEERAAYKQNQYGADGIKGNNTASMRRLGSIAAQMILSPGAHMIWQFGEMGNAQTTKNGGENNTSPKIVNWSLLDNADNEGLMQNYRQLNWLRRDNPELFVQGTQTSILLSSWNDARQIHLANNGKELICVINPSTDTDNYFRATFNSQNSADYKLASYSYGIEPTWDASAGRVFVPANSYVVLVSNNVTGVDTLPSDNMLKVYGVRGAVVVEGNTGAAEIYNMSGTRTAQEGLNAGLYFVRVDGNTYKIMVK